VTGKERVKGMKRYAGFFAVLAMLVCMLIMVGCELKLN
jgi:hypothetical protein